MGRPSVGETEADRAWAPPQAPRECCRIAANLTTIERRPHVQVRRCVCGLRHFRAIMDLAGILAPDAAPPSGVRIRG